MIKAWWDFKYDFIAKLLLSLTVKQFRKSVNIWRNNGQGYGVLFFLTHRVYRIELVSGMRITTEDGCITLNVHFCSAHGCGALHSEFGKSLFLIPILLFGAVFLPHDAIPARY